jgi:hypothetical protein
LLKYASRHHDLGHLEGAGVGCDPAAVEFQLQPAVEIDPQRAIILLTRKVFDECASNPTLAADNHDGFDCKVHGFRGHLGNAG